MLQKKSLSDKMSFEISILKNATFKKIYDFHFKDKMEKIK